MVQCFSFQPLPPLCSTWLFWTWEKAGGVTAVFRSRMSAGWLKRTHSQEHSNFRHVWHLHFLIMLFFLCSIQEKVPSWQHPLAQRLSPDFARASASFSAASMSTCDAHETLAPFNAGTSHVVQAPKTEKRLMSRAPFLNWCTGGREKTKTKNDACQAQELPNTKKYMLMLSLAHLSDAREVGFLVVR